jgi:large subunit ribosomal protein L21
MDVAVVWVGQSLLASIGWLKSWILYSSGAGMGFRLECEVQRFLLKSSFSEVHMYAVIKTGGKQYRVAAGEKIKVEQIAAEVGQEIVIDQVLAVGNGAELKVGTPLVSGATVTVTVLSHGRHDKVRIFKMRRRKHYQKRQGHRQNYTELQISAIAG